MLLTLALAASGCGGDDAANQVVAEDPTVQPAGTVPTELATTPAIAITGSPSPTAPTGSAGLTGQDGLAEEDGLGSDDGLPGEDFDAPSAGQVFAVVGVAADDTLNVRDVPGVGGDIFGALDPLADDIRTTGRGRLVEDAIWYEIEGDAAENGWVNARYLAILGDTTDITSELNERPVADTMPQMADAVVAMRTSVEQEGEGPRAVISDGPSVGDLGEVTVDIVGFADDAIAGERLHVFAEPESGGVGFRLRTVERTLLCRRGVSDGLCV